MDYIFGANPYAYRTRGLLRRAKRVSGWDVMRSILLMMQAVNAASSSSAGLKASGFPAQLISNTTLVFAMRPAAVRVPSVRHRNEIEFFRLVVHDAYSHPAILLHARSGRNGWIGARGGYARNRFKAQWNGDVDRLNIKTRPHQSKNRPEQRSATLAICCSGSFARSSICERKFHTHGEIQNKLRT